MKIKWFGQSCFLITSNNGTKIVTDPFNEKIGYILPDVNADIVTISHDHMDHNNVKGMKGDFTCFSNAGKYIKNDIEINGIDTYHDNHNGTRRGRNVIFIFTVDGINVCHCGDLGHILTEDQISRIGKVDILLIPVGGTFTIDAKKAVEVVNQLVPSIIIPMHYRTGSLFGPISLVLQKADKFIALCNRPVKEENELNVDLDNLNDYQGCVVFNI